MRAHKEHTDDAVSTSSSIYPSVKILSPFPLIARSYTSSPLQDFDALPPPYNVGPDPFARAPLQPRRPSNSSKVYTNTPPSRSAASLHPKVVFPHNTPTTPMRKGNQDFTELRTRGHGTVMVPMLGQNECQPDDWRRRPGYYQKRSATYVDPSQSPRSPTKVSQKQKTLGDRVKSAWKAFKTMD